MKRRKFIGRDGSLGYRKGKTYLLREHEMKSPNGGYYPITISRLFGGGLCPYSSHDAFVANWEKIK